jgi:hypothetical protein
MFTAFDVVFFTYTVPFVPSVAPGGAAPAVPPVTVKKLEESEENEPPDDAKTREILPPPPPPPSATPFDAPLPPFAESAVIAPVRSPDDVR